MKRITLKEYQAFYKEYFASPKLERFGQSFLNTYFPTAVDPKLFYGDNVIGPGTALVHYVKYMDNEECCPSDINPEFLKPFAEKKENKIKAKRKKKA